MVTIKSLEKQIYVLEKKLAKGSNGNQNFPLMQKINNLKKQLREKKSEMSWQEYLSK